MLKQKTKITAVNKLTYNY